MIQVTDENAVLIRNICLNDCSVIENVNMVFTQITNVTETDRQRDRQPDGHLQAMRHACKKQLHRY